MRIGNSTTAVMGNLTMATMGNSTTAITGNTAVAMTGNMVAATIGNIAVVVFMMALNRAISMLASMEMLSLMSMGVS